jgi:hypothetical protein
VQLSASIAPRWSAGTIWAQPSVGSAPGALENCNDQNPSTPCYDPNTDPTTEQVVMSQGAPDGYAGFDVFLPGQILLAPCAACGAMEREIPPLTTVSVVLRGQPFGFVLPGAGLVSAGNIVNATGRLGQLWWQCTTYTGPNHDVCNGRSYFHAIQYLTRARVDTTPIASLLARSASPPSLVMDAEMLKTANGTNVSSFAYQPTTWSTTVDRLAYPLF